MLRFSLVRSVVAVVYVVFIAPYHCKHLRARTCEPRQLSSVGASCRVNNQVSGRHCDEEVRTRQLELEEEAGVPDVKDRVGGRGRGKKGEKGEKGEFDVSNGDVGSRHRLDWTEAGMFFLFSLTSTRTMVSDGMNHTVSI